MVGLSSAAGVIGFLSEPDYELQIYALRKLNEEIDSLWTEVVDSIGEIEALYEDPSFPERELAALVAAKVYYNLQEYNESMVFALGAGKLFDIDHEGEFEDTIISKCVDTYIALSDSSTMSSTGQPPSQLTTAFPSTANGASNTSASLASPTTPFSQSTLPSRSLLSRQDSTNTFDPTAQGGGEQAAPGSLRRTQRGRAGLAAGRRHRDTVRPRPHGAVRAQAVGRSVARHSQGRRRSGPAPVRDHALRAHRDAARAG